MEMALVWILRGVGLLWVVGGALTVHQARQLHDIDRLTDEIETLAGEAGGEAGPPEAGEDVPDDRHRKIWIGLGGLMVFLAGCALLAASWLAAVLACLVCLHQTAYAARQALRTRRARGEEEKAMEALAPSTRNATLFAFLVAALAIYLTLTGAYG